MQGVYTVFVTDEYGCEISASKGVEILQSDEADAGPDQLLCTETTYTLSANTPSLAPACGAYFPELQPLLMQQIL